MSVQQLLIYLIFLNFCMILACDLCDFIPQYNLTLVASDALHESSSLVHVKINDINDLPPKFEQPSYITTILEEDAEGIPKTIMKVLWNV